MHFYEDLSQHTQLSCPSSSEVVSLPADHSVRPPPLWKASLFESNPRQGKDFQRVSLNAAVRSQYLDALKEQQWDQSQFENASVERSELLGKFPATR
jgi:hypothetical protein